MPTVAEAKHRLDGLGDKHVAVAIWQEADVFERAKERHISVTRQQVQDILARMDSHQDNDIGITWTTIDCLLDEVVKGDL